MVVLIGNTPFGGFARLVNARYRTVTPTLTLGGHAEAIPEAWRSGEFVWFMYGGLNASAPTGEELRASAELRWDHKCLNVSV